MELKAKVTFAEKMLEIHVHGDLPKAYDKCTLLKSYAWTSKLFAPPINLSSNFNFYSLKHPCTTVI